MNYFTYVFVWLCVALLLAVMLFLWALDIKRTWINKYKSYDWTWSKIAKINGAKPTNVWWWYKT